MSGGGIPYILNKIAAWIALAAVVLLVISFLLPYVVSHQGERPMIDAPGVLINGECCTEAPWHYIQRVLWLPVVPLLTLVSLAIWVVAVIVGLYRRIRIKPTGSGRP